MTAVKARDVERVLRRDLEPGIVLLLFYGPDAGLVSERARAAAERAVADPADPFQLVRLDGDVVAGDPGRLPDEAGTIGLFGGKRAIWVKPTGRNLAPAVEAVLSGPRPEALVVVEAGELGRSAPLRTLCERSPLALALPCYEDGPEEIAALLDESFRAEGIRLPRDVRDTLAASLGGDRLATRREIDKLLLYARGLGELGLEDLRTVSSDSAGLDLDAIVDAAFGGDPARTDELVRRARDSGMAPSTVLGQALRHALALLSARIEIEAGRRSARAAAETWRGLHFSRKDGVALQLAAWSAARLRRTVEVLQAAVFASRSARAAGELAGPLAASALLDIARAARASRRRGRAA